MITNYEITLARLSDAETIASLSKDAIERGLSWSWTPQRVLRSLRDAATNTIVAREPGIIAGFAIMKYRDEDAHLLLMAVHSSRRRQGVASALLDLAEGHCRSRGNRVDSGRSARNQLRCTAVLRQARIHAGRTVARLLREPRRRSRYEKTTARLAAALLQQATLLSLPVLVRLIGTFLELPLAFRQTDLKLHPAFVVVHVQRDQ